MLDSLEFIVSLDLEIGLYSKLFEEIRDYE